MTTTGIKRDMTQEDRGVSKIYTGGQIMQDNRKYSQVRVMDNRTMIASKLLARVLREALTENNIITRQKYKPDSQDLR